MSEIAVKNKSTSKKTKSKEEILVPIFIMGRKYEVPESLTIQKALEYAGYQLVRGCGCRGGICGACGTVYRFPNSYRIEVGLACQTVVESNMYITQIPFFPANKATYNVEKLEPTGSTIAALYPEIFKCVGCGTCTRSCPMDIDVMEYISRAIRGDVTGAAEIDQSPKRGLLPEPDFHPQTRLNAVVEIVDHAVGQPREVDDQTNAFVRELEGSIFLFLGRQTCWQTDRQSHDEQCNRNLFLHGCVPPRYNSSLFWVFPAVKHMLQDVQPWPVP